MTGRRLAIVLLIAGLADLAAVAGAARPTRVVPWRGVAAPPMGADTLDVHDILNRRTTLLDSLLNPELTTRDTTGLDSLVAALDGGGQAVAGTLARRPAFRFDTSWRPLTLSTYDRVNGLRLGGGLGAHAGRYVSVEADVAYAFARERWAGAASLRAVTPWDPLSVTAGWADRIVPFGSNQGAHFTSLGALVAGQDRQDYLHERTWNAGLQWRPARRARLALSWMEREEVSARAATDFRFAGGDTPIEAPNPEIDDGRTRGLELVSTWRSQHRAVSASLEGGVAGGALGGDFEFAWQRANVTVVRGVAAGDRLSFTAAGAHTAGSAPLQAVPSLGGDGTLRGFERLEFAGDGTLALRAEYSLGRDLLAHTRIPLVRSLRLQFVPFVDAGTAWGHPRAIAGSRPLDGKWKSSVGLGIQRHIRYPGLGAVRLDISRRTDGGPGGAGFWFRVLPFDIE